MNNRRIEAPSKSTYNTLFCCPKWQAGGVPVGADRDGPALALAHRVLKALWEDERDTGDPGTLATLAGEVGLDADNLLALGTEARWAERRTADTQAALARGVFGAPSYVVGPDVF